MQEEKKDRHYFQHDYNARNDDKILELRLKFGAEGYGIFWIILENMYESADGTLNKKFIGGLSHGNSLAIDRLLEILAFCVKINLFKLQKGRYLSERVMRHKKWRKSMSEFGKAGADKRWGGHS